MISVAEAWKFLTENISTLAIEIVSLDDAAGRVIATDVFADATVPANAVSAMDGYAVRFVEAAREGMSLQVVGEVPAGQKLHRELGAGEAVRIFTGGVVPSGADHILIQEEASCEGGALRVTTDQKKPSHIRAAGIDFKRGDLVLARGQKLDPIAVAILASTNHREVEVVTRPRVAILANGDELIEPGLEANTEKVICSTPYGFRPLLDSWGCDVQYLGIARDDPAAIKAMIETAEGFDVVVPIGGASVGDYDYMKSSFTELGFETVFQKIRVKPGKPTWYAKRADQHVLGLPGNPASAMVCAHLFLKPLLLALQGQVGAVPMQMAKLLAPLTQQGSRDEYWRAHAEINGDGELVVKALNRQDSSLLTPFLSANCLIERPANTPASEAGAKVRIVPVSSFR